MKRKLIIGLQKMMSKNVMCLGADTLSENPLKSDWMFVINFIFVIKVNTCDMI